MWSRRSGASRDHDRDRRAALRHPRGRVRAVRAAPGAVGTPHGIGGPGRGCGAWGGLGGCSTNAAPYGAAPAAPTPTDRNPESGEASTGPPRALAFFVPRSVIRCTRGTNRPGVQDRADGGRPRTTGTMGPTGAARE